MRLGPGHKPDWDPGTSQIGTWAQTRLGPGLLSSLVPDCVIWFLTQIQFNLSWEWFLGPNIQFRMQCFRPQMIFKAYLIRCQSSNDLQIDLVHWFIFIIRRSRHVHLFSFQNLEISESRWFETFPTYHIVNPLQITIWLL